jgi:raffinose/stachyose/melibiose transport system permease protein
MKGHCFIMSDKFSKSVSLYILVLPALIVFTVFVTIPMIQNIGYSFTEWDGILSVPKFIGLDNYKKLFTEHAFYKALTVTLEFTVVTIIFQQAVAIFLAVMINKDSNINGLFRSVFFIPSLLTTVAVGLIFTYIFNVNFGVINLLCGKLGLKSLAAVDWLGDPRLVVLMCSFTAIWQFAGYNMVIYLGQLKNISTEYYESADIDGATPFRKFTNITFPLLAPALTVNTLVTLIGGLKQFDIPYILTKGGPGDASQTIAMLLYRDAFYGSNAGYVAAESFILLVIILVISLTQAKYFSEREVNL